MALVTNSTCWNSYANVFFQAEAGHHKSHPFVPLMDVCFVFLSQMRVKVTVHYQVHTITISHACKLAKTPHGCHQEGELTHYPTQKLSTELVKATWCFWCCYFCNKVKQKIKYGYQVDCTVQLYTLYTFMSGLYTL